MEDNSAAVESLILFYINMKSVLKTRQLVERVFIDLMIKNCRENGFIYSDEEIKITWKKLVSKYLELKTKGTSDEKESWKYFEILDSCYEPSDFHNGVYPKFSEEMVWFLIECFLKRKALKKTQKHNSIVSDIHNEFLNYGYLYITKQDIENKWKYLNFKYDKLKCDTEGLNKLPYLQALKGYREDGENYIVNMVFTRELTEILIERFTEKKITCVIHGYDSDQVLSEIQSEFKDLGFYFPKEDIKKKWRTLTIIYRFLIGKGKCETSWIYFEAMKKHFKNNFSIPRDKTEKGTRRLRQRSKSLGVERSKDISLNETFVEKVSHLSKMKEKTVPSKRSSAKRSGEDRRTKSHKKMKTKLETSKQKETEHGLTEKSKAANHEDEISSSLTKTEKLSEDSLLSTSAIQQQERRNSSSLGNTSNVHIINIDQSEIDRKNGNLTINLPSITKQFSDNEFLPLKKRLRLEDDIKNTYSNTLKEASDGLLKIPIPYQRETRRHSKETNDKKNLTRKEVTESIGKEDGKGNVTNNENSTKYGNEDFNKYQNLHHFNQPLLVPKEEHHDNLTMENYTSQNTVGQPPVLLLVIKVDGASTSVKDPSINNGRDAISNHLRDSNCDSNKEISSTNIDKSASPKSKIIKEKESSSLEVSRTDTSNVIESDVVYNTNTCAQAAPEFISTDNERDVLLNVNNSDDIHFDNTEDICSVGENVTICTSEQNQNEICNFENKSLESQKNDDVVFREPLPVVKKSDSTKLTVTNKGTIPLSEGNAYLQNVKPGRIRLPVNAGGKLKEIFISPRELSKITKFKPGGLQVKNNLMKPNEVNITRNTTDSSVSEKHSPQIKFTSQVIRPATTESAIENMNQVATDGYDVSNSESSLLVPPALTTSRVLGTHNFSQARKNEEFENESCFSEAVGDDDGLKDNLLATVIDFQEQNNQEFIEIKNLMKQNNLLQRETNRLLRLILEKQ